MRWTGFRAWRAAALDRTQHVDLLRLAEHSIEADLARRDRTINTTAHTAGGDYIDPFGGMGTCIRDGCGCCRAGVRRGSAADAPHCWLASELSFAIDP
jgi:hypothetical protein